MRAREVGDAGERDHGSGPQLRAEPRPSREPQREVAAGRVADRGDAPRIDLRACGERVGGGRDVLERSRPASARAADPAVLDVPREVAARGEVVRHRRHQRAVPGIAPEAAVDHDHARATALPPPWDGGGWRPAPGRGRNGRARREAGARREPTPPRSGRRGRRRRGPGNGADAGPRPRSAPAARSVSGSTCSTTSVPSSIRHVAHTNPSTSTVPRTGAANGPSAGGPLGRDEAAAVGVGEQHVVVLGQEARPAPACRDRAGARRAGRTARGRARRGTSRSRGRSRSTTSPQPGQPRPGRDVGDRRRPERGEVAEHHLVDRRRPARAGGRATPRRCVRHLRGAGPRPRAAAPGRARAGSGRRRRAPRRRAPGKRSASAAPSSRPPCGALREELAARRPAPARVDAARAAARSRGGGASSRVEHGLDERPQQQRVVAR